MAKLKIYTFPDKVLMEKALPVPRVEKSFYRLADDMLETMYAAPGCGLAANQVGILQRILVIDVDYDLEELPENVPPPTGVEVSGNSIIKNKKPQIIINPEIIKHEGTVKRTEACLSVPEFCGEVKRFEKLTLQYQDIDGLTHKLDAEGYFAWAIQHEIDHLNGKLFIDRLSPIKKEKVKKNLLQLRKNSTSND
jgi:peptide deformylase